jgi:hypothetical protein
MPTTNCLSAKTPHTSCSIEKHITTIVCCYLQADGCLRFSIGLRATSDSRYSSSMAAHVTAPAPSGWKTAVQCLGLQYWALYERFSYAHDLLVGWRRLSAVAFCLVFFLGILTLAVDQKKRQLGTICERATAAFFDAIMGTALQCVSLSKNKLTIA